MAKFTLKNIQADHLLEILFRDVIAVMFNINIQAGPGGTVSPVGIVSVNAGADLVVDIVPDAGKELDKILLDGVEVAPDPVV